MNEQARIETAIDATIDNCELFRAQIAEQAREIELNHCLYASALMREEKLRAELATLKQDLARYEGTAGNCAELVAGLRKNAEDYRYIGREPAYVAFTEAAAALESQAREISGLKSALLVSQRRNLAALKQPISDEREAFERNMAVALAAEGYSQEAASSVMSRGTGGEYQSTRVAGAWQGWQARARLSANAVVLPDVTRVMNLVMDYQYNKNANVTGTTNWAANIGMAVIEEVARLNPSRGVPAHSEDVSVPRGLVARIADPFTSTSNLIENLRDLRALLSGGAN